MTVSIIVPVFNTERYLSECIDSILAQSFSDFEVLLIDDGSTDRSEEICDEYARKDIRVRVFHKTNGGAGSARNLGLDNARGEWICFVDSDDYVEPYYLETLSILPDKADITFFPIKKISENGDIDLQIPLACKVYGRDNVEQQLAHLKYGMPMDLFGWSANKLFCADIIKKYKVRFPEDVVFREDEIFTMNYCRHISSLEILDTPLYNYRFLQSGLTSKGMVELDYLALSDHLLENLPYYHNDILLSRDKRRIIDFRLSHFFQKISLQKFRKSFRPLYEFMNSNKELLAYSNYPVLVRRFLFPYWLSYSYFFISFIIKLFFRSRC